MQTQKLKISLNLSEIDVELVERMESVYLRTLLNKHNNRQFGTFNKIQKFQSFNSIIKTKMKKRNSFVEKN